VLIDKAEHMTRGEVKEALIRTYGRIRCHKCGARVLGLTESRAGYGPTLRPFWCVFCGLKFWAPLSNRKTRENFDRYAQSELAIKQTIDAAKV